jgi:hypothetical protein
MFLDSFRQAVQSLGNSNGVGNSNNTGWSKKPGAQYIRSQGVYEVRCESVVYEMAEEGLSEAYPSVVFTFKTRDNLMYQFRVKMKHDKPEKIRYWIDVIIDLFEPYGRSRISQILEKVTDLKDLAEKLNNIVLSEPTYNKLILKERQYNGKTYVGLDLSKPREFYAKS